MKPRAYMLIKFLLFLFFLTPSYGQEDKELYLSYQCGYQRINIKENQPIEIDLGGPTRVGYLIAKQELKPLPIGSTLDEEMGKFSWSPGVGFIGDYFFIFISESNMKTKVRVRILPKYDLKR